MPAADDELLISVKEAARRLSLTPWSVYRLADDAQIESVYQGRRRYIVVASLADYIATLPTQTPQSEKSA